MHASQINPLQSQTIATSKVTTLWQHINVYILLYLFTEEKMLGECCLAGCHNT